MDRKQPNICDWLQTIFMASASTAIIIFLIKFGHFIQSL